jgi:hypothetical protein
VARWRCSKEGGTKWSLVKKVERDGGVVRKVEQHVVRKVV